MYKAVQLNVHKANVQLVTGESWTWASLGGTIHEPLAEPSPMSWIQIQSFCHFIELQRSEPERRDHRLPFLC